MGYRYFLVSGKSDFVDKQYINSYLTDAGSKQDIEKRQMKYISSQYPKFIFYVFDDVEFTKIWVFKNGKLELEFNRYVTHYPLDLSLYKSTTGKDIMFVESIKPLVNNIKDWVVNECTYEMCDGKDVVEYNNSDHLVIFSNKSPIIGNLMPYNHPAGSIEDILHFYKLNNVPN